MTTTETETKTEMTERDRVEARILCEVRQACFDVLIDDGEFDYDFDEPYTSDAQRTAHSLIQAITEGIELDILDLRTWEIPDWTNE